ncbi:MAG TPA: FKBP-type peptidyl-prolyl cis-trans isomerase, partial [Sphingomicrobium sp.]|nr:FKBP-type peptidyl-prolyl cis-trans isomerase [Sphingomicrobium sp.]
MSVAEAAHRPANSGRAVRLWLGFLLLVAAGLGLAFWGSSKVRAQTVQVDTIQAGSGPVIKPEDGVLIEYEGRLTDGTVFDSSAGRGPTPMIAGQVIPGFAEALTRMQKGGKYKIHIPSDLAYGPNPAPGSPIPPNADLDFDVHVVQVVPNAASMMQQQQPG